MKMPQVVSRIITVEDGALLCTQFDNEVGIGRGYFARNITATWYMPNCPYVVIFALSKKGTILVDVTTSFCFIPEWWVGMMMNRYVVEGAA